MFEDFYYSTGALFFSLSIIILLVVLIYCIKILQRIVAIENELKDTINEAKNKISTFSLGMASIVTLLEKLIQMRDKMKRNESGGEDDNPKKSRKIAVKS